MHTLPANWNIFSSFGPAQKLGGREPMAVPPGNVHSHLIRRGKVCTSHTRRPVVDRIHIYRRSDIPRFAHRNGYGDTASKSALTLSQLLRWRSVMIIPIRRCLASISHSLCTHSQRCTGSLSSGPHHHIQRRPQWESQGLPVLGTFVRAKSHVLSLEFLAGEWD